MTRGWGRSTGPVSHTWSSGGCGGRRDPVPQVGRAPWGSAGQAQAWWRQDWQLAGTSVLPPLWTTYRPGFPLDRPTGRGRGAHLCPGPPRGGPRRLVSVKENQDHRLAAGQGARGVRQRIHLKLSEWTGTQPGTAIWDALPCEDRRGRGDVLGPRPAQGAPPTYLGAPLAGAPLPERPASGLLPHVPVCERQKRPRRGRTAQGRLPPPWGPRYVTFTPTQNRRHHRVPVFRRQNAGDASHVRGSRRRRGPARRPRARSGHQRLTTRPPG